MSDVTVMRLQVDYTPNVEDESVRKALFDSKMERLGKKLVGARAHLRAQLYDLPAYTLESSSEDDRTRTYTIDFPNHKCTPYQIRQLGLHYHLYSIVDHSETVLSYPVEKGTVVGPGWFTHKTWKCPYAPDEDISTCGCCPVTCPSISF